MLAFFGAENDPSLPDPSYKGRNASAIFGAGPSFGLTPAEVNIRPQFRPTPPKKSSGPTRKVKRSYSDVGIRKKPTARRKSGDFTPLRKHSESESETALNGAIFNGENNSLSLLPSRSETGDTTADSVVSLPEHSHLSSDFSHRYPLFIQVNDKAEAQNRSRVAKPVNRPAKQETIQNKRPPPRNRSASFTPVRKASDSRLLAAGVAPKPSKTNQFSQEEARVGNLRREKSDIVKSRRVAPSVTTGISRPTRSQSASNLKQAKSAVLSPRSRSPASPKPEFIENSEPRATQESRRENSDILQPSGQGCTNSLTLSNENLDSDISRSSSNRSLTSNPLKKYPLGNSIQESQSPSNSSEMSKIPSLSRSPASSESHVSRIPSLAKQNGGEERTPPRSKIPSVSKNDKGQEPTMKKSQIPTGGRKDSTSQKDKLGSKIPSSTGSPQKRSDSAKENKDPSKGEAGTATQNGHETAKQASKIPSVSKSGIPKSKIPSVTRKDSKNEQQAAINGSSGLQSPVSHVPGDTAKSRIPTSSLAPQGDGVGLARTPTSAKSLQPKQDTRSDSYTIGQSRIPTIPSTPVSKTPETKIPTPGGSKIPEPKVAANSVAKTTGIPKPPLESTPSELSIMGSRIPGSAEERAIRKISSTEKETAQSSVPVDVSTDGKSKIPSLSKISAPKTYSTSPGGNEQTPPKPKSATIPTLGGRQLSFDKEVQGLSKNPPVTPPSTPTLTTAINQTDTDIFSEAKKMEKLLRDAPMELELLEKEKEDEEFLRQEREIERQEHAAQEALGVLETKEAEDLISEVLKSYAPDINKESQSTPQNTLKETSKENNGNFKDKMQLSDEEDKLFDKKEEVQLSEPATDVGCPSIVDKKVDENAEQTPKVSETAIKGQDLKILISMEKTPTGEVKEIKNDVSDETEGSKSEGPPIDTLGEYAQQARRSRSRQRKVVSPDTEEPEKEFGKVQEKDIETEPDNEPTKKSRESSPNEEPNREIKKDKFGTAPYESEKKNKESSKPAKLKSKNEKPKFVIESSLGKDFYASRKSDEIAVSKESIQDDSTSTSNRELPALVFESKVIKPPVELKTKTAPTTEQAIAVEEAKFEDIELNPEPKRKKDRREISGSIDDLDEKTVKCMCGRGGKCSIM